MNELNRLDNEDENSYIFRICDNKDRVGTWQDVCNLLNKELNHEYNESWYRKMYQSFNMLFDAVKDKYIDKNQSAYIDEKLLEIQKEKIKLRDERTELNKSITRDARVEYKLDKLEETLKKIGKIEYKDIINNNFKSDNDLLVMLTDIHFGSYFDTYFGQYNSDICKERINQYLIEIKKIAKINSSENCYLSIQGDLISGSIHKRIALTNRENVIEQIVGVSEIVCSFVYELSKIFKNVYVYNVCGNHSRLDTKDDSLHDERLDSLISWYMKAKLNNNKNIFIEDNTIDNSISCFEIRGQKYVGVHGDYDNYSSSGCNKLCSFLGFFPYAILFAHLHECSYSVQNGILMVRGGCLSGTGDDYTLEKRLFGKPSQMICMCTEDGIKAFYPVELK